MHRIGLLLKKSLKKRLINIGATIGVLSAVFGGGYGAGVYLMQLNNGYEKIRLHQEFSEKLEEERERCKRVKLEEYHKTVEELKDVVAKLKDRGYAK